MKIFLIWYDVEGIIYIKRKKKKKKRIVSYIEKAEEKCLFNFSFSIKNLFLKIHFWSIFFGSIWVIYDGP